MRSFERPSGPSRPAAPVTCVTKHRIMRDNVLHPHFQSSRFSPHFFGHHLLCGCSSAPMGAISVSPKPTQYRLYSGYQSVRIRSSLLLPILATRTIFPAPCTYPTKERSRAPTHCITEPFVAPLSDSEKREKTPNTARYHKKQ